MAYSWASDSQTYGEKARVVLGWRPTHLDTLAALRGDVRRVGGVRVVAPGR